MLSTALQSARTGLAAAGEQIDIASRNIALSGSPEAARKSARLASNVDGGLRVVGVDRADDPALRDAALGATAAASDAATTRKFLSRLQSLIGTVGDAGHSAAIGRLADALQTYAANPADAQRARAVVAAAGVVARGLNEAGEAALELRREADREIAAAVERVNGHLAEFEAVNRRVLAGTRAGRDVSNDADRRDQLIKLITADVGVRVVRRADNDVALYATGGATLFETVARPVSVQSAPLLAGQPGSTVYIDGTPVAGPGTTMPLGAGSLGRLVDLRDGVIERVSAQLDEIARALVAGFAERDSLGVLPDVAGLFSAGTSTAVPPDGIRFAGLSTALRLNPAYDPAAGGDAFRVRDAGSGGAAYVANPSGSAGFAEHVIELGRRLSAARSYDVSAGVDARGGPAAYAEAAAADLAQGLQQASADHEARAAVAARAGDALARAVGISLDEEMATMLQLERSFQASSRLLTAIDDLYRVLIASVGAA